MEKYISNGVATIRNGNGDPVPADIPKRIKEQWNGFVKYVEGKKLPDRTALDKNGLGYQYFDEYVKTLGGEGEKLNRDWLPKIFQAADNWRQTQLKNFETGKARYMKDPDTPLQNPEQTFMSWVEENKKTAEPHYPGSRFTKFVFPDKVIVQKGEDGKYKEVERKPLAVQIPLPR